MLIVQNDLGNQSSPTVIAVPLTTRRKHPGQPTHVQIKPPEGGLRLPSQVLCEQVRTLEKSRLKDYLGSVSPETLARVEQALGMALGTAR